MFFNFITGTGTSALIASIIILLTLATMGLWKIYNESNADTKYRFTTLQSTRHFLPTAETGDTDLFFITVIMRLWILIEDIFHIAEPFSQALIDW